MQTVCTETACFPSQAVDSDGCLAFFYRFRFRFIRHFTCPIPYLRPNFPVIGGKSFLELLFVFGTYALTIGICRRLVVGESGGVASAGAGLVVILALRNNVATVFFGISFERALFFHKLGAVLVLALSIIHGYQALTQDSSFVTLINRNTNGLILLIMMGFVSLVYALKKYLFEYFYVLHVLIYALIVPVAIAHGATLFALAALLWAFDLCLRYVVCLNKVTVTAENLVGDVVKITMKKPFTYSAGQYCFLMIPSLSVYQFHPFSISSAPQEDKISFHIRALGNWTTCLQMHVAERSKLQTTNKCNLDMYIEGPFGLSSIDIDDPSYSVVLLISGGIGVTPTQSIYNYLLRQHIAGHRTIRKCIFVWSVKDRATVNAWDIEQLLKPSGEDLIKQDKDKGLLMQNLLNKPLPQRVSASSNAAGSLRASTTDQYMPISFQPSLVMMNDNFVAVNLSGAQQSLAVPTVEADESMKRSSSSNAAPGGDRQGGLARGSVWAPRAVSFSFLNDLSTPDPFHCEFYLTALRSKDQFQASQINQEAQPFLRFGRPDIPRIFERVAELCSRENIARVAVVTCGPAAMVDEVSGLCDRPHSGVRFDLHKEVFDF